MLNSLQRTHATNLISQIFNYLIHWSQYEVDSSTHDRILAFLWTMPALHYTESQLHFMLNHLKMFLFDVKATIHLRLLAVQILGIMIFHNTPIILCNSSLKNDILVTTESLLEDPHPEVSVSRISD